MLGRRRNEADPTNGTAGAANEPPAAAERNLASEVADYIRRCSEEHRLASRIEVAQSPLSIPDEDLDSLLETAGLQEDIRSVEGTKDVYYFSDRHMSPAFAKLTVRLEENDLLGMLVEQVRDDSRIYPRPTPARQFYNAPYRIEKEQLVTLLASLKADEEYEDIELFETTNGAQYLASRKFMHPDQAKAMAQLQEVEDPERFF
jgi:hypothetical protein